MALFLILIFWLIPEQFEIKSQIEFVTPYRINISLVDEAFLPPNGFDSFNLSEKPT